MKRLLVDSSVHETRVALMIDGVLTEVICEEKRRASIVGNIYSCRVVNILPGVKAAFVDIGQEKNAYLPYETEKPKWKIGQELLVQVEKDAFLQKGAVVTEKISFTGKFLVLLLKEKTVGISSKITDKRERARIREIMGEILPEGFGVIVRTNGEGKEKEDFEKEFKRLLEGAENLLKEGVFRKAPALVSRDIPPVLKAARELFTSDVEECLINQQEDFKDFCALEEEYGEDISRVKLYEENIPLFENYFAESQLEKALQKKVWLKSGGFLIIEETEACVVIDVNTGKFTGKKDQQKTILKTNLEAALEVAKQCRLRNLSGIIIVDFIDMKQEEDRITLRETLEKAVSHDRLKTTVVGMTELGLMQLTRKKTRPSLMRQMMISCRCCNGRGFVYDLPIIVGNIRREIISIFTKTIFSTVTVKAEERLLMAFAGEKDQYKNELEETYHKTILLKPDPHQGYGQYTIERK